MMNHLFHDLIMKGKVVIYLDDILIFSKNIDEHRQITRQVLQILRENKLLLKPQKCKFEMRETKYLGMIIGNGQIRMDPKKVEAINKWSNPKNKKELQQFLGFANFYRRFIEGYSKVVKPLTKLTGNEIWKWNKEQQDAFDELKRLVCTNPVLTIPLDDALFRMEVDASDYAIGGILSQKVDDKWRPVAYMSQALSETERNYEIYDKEMLAIMKGLTEW